MITRKEVEACRQNGGRISRIERSAILWLAFYAFAAVVGLGVKVGTAGANLVAALSPL